uniref:Uncharacterized protein n=1 Tax=Tanacetum cinerariifolium TaxID=118510 RepID=A0A6L2MPZ4_TANCI|nr:hypothetical protein [Tanacetum cinerariifolium]
MQTSQFAGAVSSILGIVQRYMDQQMNEAVKVAVKIQYDYLRDEAQLENDEFLKTIDENMQKIIKEQTSYAVVVDLSEMELKKIHIEKMEGNKSIHRSNEQRNLYKALVEAYESDKIILDTYGDTVTLKRCRDDDADKDDEPSAGSDQGSKRRREGKEPESTSTPQEKAAISAGKSTQGCLKYTSSVTKTKAADYRHIKWIEDLVPRTMWIQEPIGYDKHVLWGISHWGRKPQQFYGFAVNRESARDVYSKRRIIAVTELKIVEWHNYKHLDWIMVRRDDDKLYKFKEGDFKRLRIQDIEDMLLLLVQGKLTNLIVEERFAFNVSLRMFTRSIVIKRRVEDLQLGVESYKKKLNLTKLGTYCSDLKCKEAYIAYSNPRGCIYQNKDKQNRLMRIDELHKFNDGTLTDVRTTLDDYLKGIQIKYLPQSIWKKSDKDIVTAMIQAINKRLKSMRIMRSLKRFVGGRLKLNNGGEAGNPVKEILLKLNLPDHRSILTDSKEYIKKDVEVPGSSRLTRFIATCSYSTDIYKDIKKAQKPNHKKTRSDQKRHFNLRSKPERGFERCCSYEHKVRPILDILSGEIKFCVVDTKLKTMEDKTCNCGVYYNFTISSQLKMFQTTVRSESLKTEVKDVNNGSYQQQKEVSATVLTVGRNLSQVPYNRIWF